MWFKRFRTRNSYAIRRITKVAQRLPKNVLENVREFLYKAIKDNYEYNTDINSNIIANVDETPVVLEPITGTTLEKIGEKTDKSELLVNQSNVFLVYYVYLVMAEKLLLC